MPNLRPMLPSALLSQLSEFITLRTGLHFPQERWADLERGLAAAAPDFNCSDLESCARWLLSAPLTRQMTEILASHLSVGETYFFREPQSLEILQEQILIPLLQSRCVHERRLRLWSAGCSTGEEAYTLAILLDRLIPDIDTWNITILATDFNPKVLRKAAQGVYGEWSFRNAPVWLRQRYFTRCDDGRYEIQSRIRKMVSFSYLNFADDAYPSLTNNTSAMDVILCRNVLMYFTPQRARQVADNFYHALVSGGWLIVSPTETSNSVFSSFTSAAFPGAVLYRKGPVAESALCVSEPLTEPSSADMEITPFLQPLPQPASVPGVTAARMPPNEPAPPNEGEKFVCMARNRANQGRLDEALEWCEKAVAADKLNPLYHYLGATVLQEQGRRDIARQWLMRTLYLDPDFVLAHFSLANLHQSEGHYQQARRYFGNVLALLRPQLQGDILPEADGLTVGRLAEIVTSLLESLPELAETSA